LVRGLIPLLIAGYAAQSLGQLGFAIALEHDSSFVFGRVWSEPVRADYLGMLDWVKGNVPQDAVIMTAGDRTTFFLTGRHTVRPPDSRDATELLERIDNRGVHYCLVEANSPKHIGRWADYLESHHRYFRLCKQVGKVLLYEVVNSAPGSAD